MPSREEITSFRRIIRRLPVYLLLLYLPEGLHIWNEYFVRCPDDEMSWSRLVAGAPFGYQYLTTSGHRVLRPHYVKIVSLAKGQEPEDIFSPHFCNQRLFMARLVRRVEVAGPAMIVIDKFFSPTACEDTKVNDQLRDSIVASTVPVVVGLGTLTRDDLEQDATLSQAEKREFKDACLVLAPALALDQDHASKLTFGLTRLSRDTRKLPLQWPVYDSVADLRQGKSHSVQTLSLATTRQFENGMPHAKDLDDFVAKGQHPFVAGFLKDVPSIPAIKVLCGFSADRNASWRDCPKDSSVDDKLRSRVVLIGEFGNKADVHQSVIGEVPGVVLQANYIESQLDDRYLKPVSKWIALAVNLLWVALIESCFALSPSMRRAISYSILCMCVLWLLSYVIVSRGYFLPMWEQDVWVVLIFLRALEAWREHLREPQHELSAEAP